MDNYEFNWIFLWGILCSCLSNINKLIPLLHYGILLPEEEGDCSILSISNFQIDELKQILESYSFINSKENKINFIIDTYGHGDNYSWSMFRLDNSLYVNYFAKIPVGGFDKYKRNTYYIGLGYNCETKINLPTQLQFKNHVSVRN